jgi:hypothetical protein
MSTDAKRTNVRYMATTAGWRVTEQEILTRIESAKDRLLTAKSMEEVIEHQTKAKTLKSVLLFVKNTIDEGGEEGAEV